ncbi:MAG: hypothetical protein ACK4GN_03530 [Runella sp.]
MLNKTTLTIAGIVLGGIGGYIYWKEVGCLTGTCPLKANWQTMIPYGMLIGYVVVGFVEPIFRKKTDEQ